MKKVTEKPDWDAETIMLRTNLEDHGVCAEG